jgi:hypothetical protein
MLFALLFLEIVCDVYAACMAWHHFQISSGLQDAQPAEVKEDHEREEKKNRGGSYIEP